MDKKVPTLNDLRDRYDAGMSMWEIAQELQFSVHKVAYWMKKYNISRRTRSDATYIKFNPNGDPFFIKQNLTNEEQFLLGLGVGIYWGEGDKVAKNAIRVANSDPNIITIFARFLLEICGLERRKLFFHIVCFNDSDPESVRKYWAELLMIPPEKFGKIVQIPPQGKGTYKRKSQFGVCTLVVSNPKLKSWLMEEIEKVKRLDSLVVKHTLGKGKSASSILAPGSL